VLAEVERLGTIDAVGGTFDLTRFHRALRINLDAAALRDGRAGEGVLVADHRIAGGLRFRHAVICGAAEGLLPAGPGPDALVDDAPWAAMAAAHPLIDHAARRLDRARAAAHRAVGCADTLVLTCPLYEAAGAHERYPSPLAVEVMRARMPDLATAGALRAAPPSAWVHRPASPLAAHLRGPVLDRWEAGLREAVARVGGAPAPSPDPLARALTMVRARAGRTLTEWDGHLGDMAPSPWLAVPDSVSPTRLEAYGRCGFRFMLATLLRVRVPEEPADPETIDPLVRGGIVHTALERFLRGEIGRGRPAPGEAWTDEDAARLLGHLDDALEEARRRGVGGLPVFTRHEERRLRADLVTFLAEDSAFRRETRATPAHVEERIDAVGPHGQRFHGYADRIDRGADGTVWVIDYKTGRPPGKDDALGGGTLLQRPVYLLSVPPGVPAVAVYWYISARGGFLRDEWHRTPENDAAFDAAVGAIRDGVAAGAFPAVPGAWDDFFSTFANCGRCDFTRICSRSREDDFTRKQGDAAVLRWQAVTGGDGGG
jgi:RecB family exonuclease